MFLPPGFRQLVSQWLISVSLGAQKLCSDQL